MLNMLLKNNLISISMLLSNAYQISSVQLGTFEGRSPVCCSYVVVVVDCRVQINGGRIVDVLRNMVGMLSILEC